MSNQDELETQAAGSDTRPLILPAKLYGREPEQAALLQAFAEAGAGSGRMLLLPGHSGSGKTALVRALREPVRAKNGFFLEGKFNQYQQGIPLAGLRQALRQLAGELRTAAPPDQQCWKARILQAVGELGRLLTELSPELELLLGAQPPLPDISPYEAPHRFAAVLRRFLGVFCQPEHPVVLFVDDWQWADSASLAVLEQLQVNTTLRYLLVVAAFRDTEVDAAHPFSATVEALRRQQVPVGRLEVCDLALPEVHALLADTLRPAAEDLEGLAGFMHHTTQGNPFFLRALLGSLHQRRALWFAPRERVWRWQPPPPEAGPGAGDVVELFIQNLRSLPAECRHLLSLAACLGHRFELELLALASERSPAECLRQLSSALEQKVIMPADGEPGGPAVTRGEGQFRFQHDRVQQAAHSLIGRAELPGVCLKMGRLLAGRLAPARLEERLLEVTDHFNAGRGLLRDPAEQMQLVELNIAAGGKARAATAYRAALQFHRMAGDLLAGPGLAEAFWDRHHERAMQLFLDWAESEFLEGDRAGAERCIQEAVAHARTPLEQADALCVLVLQYTLLARYPEAIATGRRALGALGITLPEDDFEAVRDAEIAQVRRHLEGRAIASFREMPVMSDPLTLMETKVLITLGPACYRSHQRLWSVLVPKVVDLTLRYGPVPQVGYSHPAFGGLLGWVANDYATARQFGELATRLMTEIFESPADQSVFYLMMGSSTRHWFQPLSVASEDYVRAWEAGLRSGNLQYAAYAFGHNMYCRFYQGLPLARLIEESEQSLAFSRDRTNQWAIDLLQGGLQVFRTLAGPAAPAPASAPWSEAAYLQEVDAHQNIQVACIYRVLQSFALLVLGQAERALTLSEAAAPLLYSVGLQGLLSWPEHVCTRLVLLATLYPQAEAGRQAIWREELERALQQLQLWTRHCPENYAPKLALARAELARLEGRRWEALGRYDEAAGGARVAGFTQWEALAYERAAGLAQAAGQGRLAQLYWQKAYGAYHQWGAAAKVRLMEQEFLAGVVLEPRVGGAEYCGSKPASGAALHACLEQHLQSLRRQLLGREDPAHPPGQAQLVAELTQATNHLREEVAARKRAEAESEQHRQRLAQEVQQRTRVLHATQVLARQFKAQARALAEQRRRLEQAHATALHLMEDVAAARDRTEQANAALRGSEERLRRLNDELEQRVQQRTAQLEAANRELEAFSYSVSHDLRAPLRAVDGFAQILAQQSAGQLDPEGLRLLGVIRGEAARMGQLIDDLLAFSTMGRRQMQSSPIAMEKLADEVFAACAAQAAGRKLRFAATALLPALGDPAMIRQVLANLLSNAIKYTQPRAVAEIEMGSRPEGPQNIYWVKDNGVGFDMKYADRLFGVFQRLHREEEFEGTGVGLALVQRIVQRHGGRVWAESRLQQGATFYFTLFRITA